VLTKLVCSFYKIYFNNPMLTFAILGTLTQNEMTVVKIFTTHLIAATHFSSGATELADLAGNNISHLTDPHLGSTPLPPSSLSLSHSQNS
jgi:hypothetical protein